MFMESIFSLLLRELALIERSLAVEDGRDNLVATSKIGWNCRLEMLVRMISEELTLKAK